MKEEFCLGDNLNEIRPIQATFEADPSWKRFEQFWESETIEENPETVRFMDVSFFDADGVEQRVEQWILDENGNPRDLVYESVYRIERGRRYRWYNSGGYICYYPDPECEDENPVRKSDLSALRKSLYNACRLLFIGLAFISLLALFFIWQ